MSTVVAYRNNERQCFCQIKFDSGERVLISIAAAPTPSVKVLKLALGGLVPRQTIWEYNPTMAGGYNAYVENLMRMFASAADEPAHPLDAVRDALLPCGSLEEARRTLLTCESRASKGAPQQSEPSKPFDQALLSLGNSLRSEGGFADCETLEDAAAQVLTDLVVAVLAEAGPGHFPHPIASSTANASVGACFLAACLTAIQAHLDELQVQFDARDVLARAGFAVFQMYTDEDQAEIISAGADTFKNMLAEASSHENVQTWVENVQTSVAVYVLTQDNAWIKPLAELYVGLAAARE